MVKLFSSKYFSEFQSLSLIIVSEQVKMETDIDIINKLLI